MDSGGPLVGDNDSAGAQHGAPLRPAKELVLERTTEGYRGEQVSYSIPLTAYPTATGVIIINSPGAGESKEGRRGRYNRIARHLQTTEVASVITYAPPQPDGRTEYPWDPYAYRGASWNRIAVESMQHVIEHALGAANEICGSETPVLYLSGFSAGGSVCGAVASQYGTVQRVLLLSAYDSVGEYFYTGIRQYTGEIYVVYGSEDPMAGFLAMMLPHIAPVASVIHAQQIGDCDHGFKGETNGRILSKAYLWAFAGDESFPSPEGGLVLEG
jgi:hypothetical protein